MKPQISIIVPVYNAQSSVSRCAESILAQSYRDYELILVDDGSKDDSFQACQQLAKDDERVKVFHKENGGASSARQYGVEHAVGEFVFFVDSDDTIPEETLSSLIEAASANHLDIVQGERCFIPLDGSRQKVSGFKKEEVCDSKTYIKYLFEGYTNCGPVATMFKRSLFDQHSFDLPEDVKLNEDFYMNMCLGLNAERVGLIRKTVYNYIENGKSVTHNYSFNSLTPQKHLFESMKRVMDEHGVFDEFSHYYYARLISSVSSACFHNQKLLKDPYAKFCATEARQHLISLKDKALCYLLINRWPYPFFVVANKGRQIIHGYRRY